MDSTEERPQGGYETKDVDVRAVLRPALALVLLPFATLLLMRWLLHAFEAREAVKLDSSLLARDTGRQLPPEPRLQVSPSEDLAAMRAEEEAILTTYGWADRASGVVRIPIERAMELLVQRGLPVRSAAR